MQEKIKTIDSEIDSNSSDNIGEDAVSQVLGKERPGRVRGMGRGATITKMAYLQARDKHVQKLEATQAELITKHEKLQNVVIDLAGKKVTFLYTCPINFTWCFNMMLTCFFVVLRHIKMMFLVLKEAMVAREE